MLQAYDNESLPFISNKILIIIYNNNKSFSSHNGEQIKSGAADERYNNPGNQK